MLPAVPRYRREVIRLFQWQVAVLCIVVALAALVFSLKTGFSCLLGGSIALLGNVAFAFFFFNQAGPSQLKKMAKGLWRAEIAKWVLTALLFYGVIRWCDVVWVALFVAYLSIHISFWVLGIKQA